TDEHVGEVYAIMHRLRITWAPSPPYPQFGYQEATDELTRIANRLEDEDPKNQDGCGANPGTERGEGEGASTRKLRRGRKVETDANADKRILDAWRSGHHRDYAALATALGLTKAQVKQALDRHRKRQEKRGRSGRA